MSRRGDDLPDSHNDADDETVLGEPPRARRRAGAREVKDTLRAERAARVASATADEVPAERLIPLARSHRDDREVTVYVKGFLGKNEEAEHFNVWMESHSQLEERLCWGPRAHGYCWPAGRLDGIPIPRASAAKTAWDVVRMLRGLGRANLVSAAGMALAEEVGLVALHFVRQYRAASRASRERAEVLAGRLEGLSRRYERVRVVAHSLGARHVIEACASMSPSIRPHELHLCAPAVLEADVDDKLHDLAREGAVVYWSRNDVVLRTGFALLTLGTAIGASGLRGSYSGLRALDVGSHLGLRVHSGYKLRLHRFAVDPRLPLPEERSGALVDDADFDASLRDEVAAYEAEAGDVGGARRSVEPANSFDVETVDPAKGSQ